MNIQEMREKTEKFFDNNAKTVYQGDEPILNRIADALEKIGKELEKTNRLKALSFRETYVELDEIDEIMEG